MTSHESELHFSGLSRGDAKAVQQVWERYYDRLIRLAHKNLRGTKRDADEEDVVQSALNSFFNAAAAGRFPQLDDEAGLWKLLITFTLRKISKRHRRQSAEKRGGNKVRGESVFRDHRSPREPGPGLNEFAISDEPTPEFAAEMMEVLDQILKELPDDDLREIVMLKLEGYRNVEIAEKLDVVEMTISRKMKRIRERWLKFTNDEQGDAGSARPDA